MSWSEEIIRTCPNSSIGRLMADAIETLLKRDSILLETDANERAISAQLACYLKLAFPEWDVDVEYNRLGADPKKIQIGGTPELVYPDIIIHRRNLNENLLVVEMKKGDATEPDEGDMKKLNAYVTQFEYQIGLFLRLSTTAPNVSGFRWVP